jgi:hypothetical protein
MATRYCALCGRPVEAKRHIGLGTIALAVVTGGVWLLAVPFYQKRCSICLSPALSPAGPADAGSKGGGAAHGPALQARLADIERRLSLTEGELESANIELDRIRNEQDFYRKLLDDPAARSRKRLGGD